MTENEKIKCAIHCLKVNADMEVCEECEVYTEGDLVCRDIAREAIKALEELQMYRDGKLCLVPKDAFKRQCEELDAYKELGTVEEVGEAVEKGKAKKCVQDTCHDHTHYKCPTCGKIHMSVYARGCPRLGIIPNNCDNCGQRLECEE